MIQKEMRDNRGEIIQLTPNDLEYWNGPYRYEPYPKMLFRYTQPGQTEPEACVVQNIDAHNAKGPAWREDPDAAKSYFDGLETDMAKAAAESSYADRLMSAKAKVERLAHERATGFDMVTDVPRKP